MKKLSEIRKERLDYLAKLKPLYRAMDGALEKVERELKRVLNRKRAVPEQEDLIRIVEQTKTLDQHISIITKALGSGYPE